MSIDPALWRVLENSGKLLSAKLAAAVLSLVYLAAMARSLGPAGFGQFAIISAFAQALVGIAGFQAWRPLVAIGAECNADGDRQRLCLLARYALRIEMILAVIGLAISPALAMLVADLLGWDSSRLAMVVAYTAVCLLSMRGTAVGLMRLDRQFGLNAKAETCVPLVRFGGGICVAIIAPSIEAFLLVWALAEIFSAAYHWWLVRKHQIFGRIDKAEDRTLARTDVRRFVHLSAQGQLVHAATVAQQTLPLTLVGVFAGDREAGLFRLGWQLAQALQRLGEALGRTLFSELAHLVSMKQTTGIARLRGQANHLALGAGAAITLAGLVGVDIVLQSIGGTDYTAGATVFYCLLPVAGLDLLIVTREQHLFAGRQAMQIIHARLAGVACLLAVSFGLAAPFEELAVAIASVCAAAMVFGMMAIPYRSSRPERDALNNR